MSDEMQKSELDAADEARAEQARAEKAAPKRKSSRQLQQEAKDTAAEAAEKQKEVEAMREEVKRLREAIRKGVEDAKAKTKKAREAQSAADSRARKDRDTLRINIAGRWLLTLAGTDYEGGRKPPKINDDKLSDKARQRRELIEVARNQWGEQARAIVRAMMDAGYLTTDSAKDAFLTAAERKAKTAENQPEQPEQVEQAEQPEQETGKESGADDVEVAESGPVSALEKITKRYLQF